MRKKVLVLLLFFLPSFPILAQSAQEVWQILRQKYLKPTVRIELQKQKSDFSLTLYYQHQFSFAIYSNMHTLYCDGKSLWLYKPQQKQVIKSRFLPELIPPEVRMLIDSSFVPANMMLRKMQSSENPDLRWSLDLIIQQPGFPFAQISLRLDEKYQPRQIALTDHTLRSEIWNVVSFAHIHPDAADSVKFTPPSDVEIIDLEN